MEFFFFFFVPFSCFDSVFVSIECKHCWHRTHLRVCSSAFIHCISSTHSLHHHSDQHSPSLNICAFFFSFRWVLFSSGACFLCSVVLVAPTPTIAYTHCQYKFTYLQFAMWMSVFIVILHLPLFSLCVNFLCCFSSPSPHSFFFFPSFLIFIFVGFECITKCWFECAVFCCLPTFERKRIIRRALYREVLSLLLFIIAWLSDRFVTRIYRIQWVTSTHPTTHHNNIK